MSKFRVGDRIIQVNKDYPITKRGWLGTVVRVLENEIRVKWDDHYQDDTLTVRKKHVRRLTKLDKALQ